MVSGQLRVALFALEVAFCFERAIKCAMYMDGDKGLAPFVMWFVALFFGFVWMLTG